VCRRSLFLRTYHELVSEPLSGESAMSSEDDLDDTQPLPEEIPPFWMKALFIIVGIPMVNCIFPGSVVALATFIGLPDPKHRDPFSDIAVPLPMRTSFDK
jgi:hypothetical protein